ncbi:uncharacterized protein LOC124819130 [Hydra vulgaris]|uniref:uncharacterized protein LOC124819130 n=1 Tax=Hydra vulgaris TaxID=6087 RepID=UPI001F5F7314|nr:uncharacterized protein LOC124819130 [Hydra vulgaris]
MHFLDGTPTIANPDPTLNMGYNSTNIKPRKSVSTEYNDTNNNTTEDNTNDLCSNNNDNAIYLPPPSCEHSYASQSLLNVCEGCNSKTSFIDSLVKKNTSKLKRRFQSIKYRKHFHCDEFVLTLMRFRLGILNEDIAEQFGISATTSSNIFSTWIKVICNVLGSAFILWLPRENIRENLPRILRMQDITRISLSGFINFLSDCYGGGCSDNFITKDSGFYDLLERDDDAMADRGFRIQEELLLRFCTLMTPPGALLKSQMIASECKKTKKIANLRIHVEKVTNRMKT